MHIDLKGLLEGINNSIFVKDEIEKLSEERLATCKTCPYYSPNALTNGLLDPSKVIRKDAFCIDCGCNMYLKSRSPSSHCPLGDSTSNFPGETSKWGPVTDDDTANKILETEEIKKDLIDYKIKLMTNKVNENGTQE